MSVELPPDLPLHTIRVRIDDAHLEYALGTSSCYFLRLYGTVESSDLGALPSGSAFEVTLGDIEPESYGLIVKDSKGIACLGMVDAEVEGVKTIMALSHRRPGALVCDIALHEKGHDRASVGLYWGAPVLTLVTRGLLSSKQR